MAALQKDQTSLVNGWVNFWTESQSVDLPEMDRLEGTDRPDYYALQFNRVTGIPAPDKKSMRDYTYKYRVQLSLLDKVLKRPLGTTWMSQPVEAGREGRDGTVEVSFSPDLAFLQTRIRSEDCVAVLELVRIEEAKETGLATEVAAGWSLLPIFKPQDLDDLDDVRGGRGGGGGGGGGGGRRGRSRDDDGDGFGGGGFGGDGAAGSDVTMMYHGSPRALFVTDEADWARKFRTRDNSKVHSRLCSAGGLRRRAHCPPRP